MDSCSVLVCVDGTHWLLVGTAVSIIQFVAYLELFPLTGRISSCFVCAASVDMAQSFANNKITHR